MLMVVFGAGASYDSYPSLRPPVSVTNNISPASQELEEHRPPLAHQLFSERDAFAKVTSAFPECQPIIPFLRHVRGSSVEQVLEDLQSRVSANPRRAIQLAAIRHYLQFIIVECEDRWRNVHNGITNYTTLLDEIEDWRQRQDEPVCLVTFNYDMMIEKALPSVGVTIAEMRDYISKSYLLIKLHGSVDWGREVGGVFLDMKKSDRAIAQALIDKAPHLQLMNKFEIITSRPIAKSLFGYLIPALAIPIVKKQQYECPDEHVAALDKFLPHVTKLLIVGWRANEQHFLERLKKGLKNDLEVMVVSGNAKDAEETIANLEKTRMQKVGDYKRAEHGFSQFILRRTVRELLFGDKLA
ncbi:MAG: hypothetical protein ABIU05_18145 [Nitrospirales bacterium]